MLVLVLVLVLNAADCEASRFIAEESWISAASSVYYSTNSSSAHQWLLSETTFSLLIGPETVHQNQNTAAIQMERSPVDPPVTRGPPSETTRRYQSSGGLRRATQTDLSSVQTQNIYNSTSQILHFLLIIDQLLLLKDLKMFVFLINERFLIKE